MKKFFPPLEFANVPNLVTATGLTAGIIACSFLVQGNLRNVIICLCIATSMDVIDGFLARKMDKQTRFGQYMDMLTDFFICCGVPILMLFAFTETSVVTIPVSVFYALCGLFRLAYFISVTAAENQTHFTGLPAPGAMLLVIAAIWLTVYYGLPVWFCAAVFICSGFLMVSFVKIKKYGICQKLLCVAWLAFLVMVVVS
jgi:CDP-diacylglycerol--serine O-phosphatidyltransferase